MQTLSETEQEIYRTGAGLYEVCSEKINPLHNKTILSLQYCKLTGEQNESSEEWIGQLKLKANGCGYKEETEESCSNS